MKLGVIICPNCKKVKGVDINYKTTKCFGCGKTLNLKKLKIFYKTDSTDGLKKAIGLLNADLDGKKDVFEKLF
jgi:hypothetical protein